MLLKDLSNISLDSKRGQSRNDLDTTIKVLMENYGMYNYYINQGSSLIAGKCTLQYVLHVHVLYLEYFHYLICVL